MYSQSGPDGRLEVSAGPAEVAATLGPEGRGARVSAPITDGWHHVGVAAGDHLAIYVDGKEIQSVPAPRVHLNQGPVLGAAGKLHSFGGALDGVRIANVARPAAWFSLQYLLQKPDTTAIAYGEDESRSSGGMQKELGLISQLLGSVTIDGWIVIALIAIVGLLSGDVLVHEAAPAQSRRTGRPGFLGGFAERWAADGAQLAAAPGTVRPSPPALAAAAAVRARPCGTRSPPSRSPRTAANSGPSISA